jgi:hypothetical protein
MMAIAGAFGREINLHDRNPQIPINLQLVINFSMQQRQKLQSWWEFAAICQFLHLFFDSFGTGEFDSHVTMFY